MFNTCNIDDPLSVAIVSQPMGPEVNVAETLSLSCIASGGTGIYSYQWTSTCTGDCLNSGDQVASAISRIAAKSADSGVYECTVTDNAGNNGTNSTEVQVVGMYVHMISRVQLPCKIIIIMLQELVYS